jgi:hypothetical protein
MKKIKYIYNLIPVLGSLVLLTACTDLEEQIIDESTGKEFLVEENLYNLVAPSYNTVARLWCREWVWGLQEATTDECMFPTRGTDWWDGGVFQDDFLHTWTPEHRDVVKTWNELGTGMGRANYSRLLLDDFEETQEVNWFRAELRFNTALFMYYYLDLYGRVPERDYTSMDFAKENPHIYDRTRGFDFIVREVKEMLPLLGDKYVVPYGRPNKDAARMLLAKLYLNKEAYTGQAAYDSCLIYVNELINSGRYALATDYFDIFYYNNEENYTDNDEAILVSVMDDREDMGHGAAPAGWVQQTFHYNQNLGGGYNPWNGCVAPEDYLKNTMIAHTDTATDVRWRDDRIYGKAAVYLGFNYGQQYSSTGAMLTERDNKTPLYFTWDCPLDGAAEAKGVRVLKYIPKTPPEGIPTWTDNDFVIWRIGDAYLMRAECNLRLGNSGDALQDINEIRTVRNAPLLSSVDLDDILAERALELYWEGHRRQDMIRFGTFLDARINKPEVSPSTKLLLPIPQVAVDAIDDNSLLPQNPGY